MTRDERRPYEIMASERRNNPHIKKYTSDGMDIEQIEKEEQEELAAISAMQQHIHNEMVALYKANGRSDFLPMDLFNIYNFFSQSFMKKTSL